MSIQNSALLVKVQTSRWSVNKRDKGLGEDLSAQQFASAEALRVHKTLTSDPIVTEINKLYGQITNQVIRKVCVPWDEGEHLLVVDLIDKFEDELREKTDRIDALKVRLGGEYDRIVRDAQRTLGLSFNPEDYPPASEVLGKYSVRVSYRPLPESGDIRVDLPADKLARIKADIEQSVTSRVDDAVAIVRERVADALTALIEGLERHGVKADGAKRTGSFKDSTIDNLLQIAEVLPSLNLTGDPAIAEVTNDLIANLTNLDANELREDVTKRKQTVATAKAIASKLDGLL